MTPRGLLIAAGLVLLGFLPHPRDWLALQDSEPSALPGLYAVLSAAQLGAVLPFALALLITASGGRLSAATAGLPAGLAGVAGLSLTVLAAIFAGAGATLTLAEGSLVTLAVVGCLLWTAGDGLRPGKQRLAGLAVLVPAVAAAWSLASVAAVVLSANRLADGAPFCLARHEAAAAPIRSLWDLRGFAFYTTRSGYKDTSEWYFHGLLVVDAPGGERVFNWSPQRLRFDLVEHPDAFVASLRSRCEPRPDFWRSL